MNRNEMVDRLVDDDIKDLTHQLMYGDFFLIDAILRGDAGWKQYAFLSDEEILAEFNDRIKSKGC